MPKKTASKKTSVPSKKVAKPKAKAKAAAPKAKPKKKVQAVPDRYGSVTPTLVVSPCAEALEFYVKAFGAKVSSTMAAPDGIIVHAELKIGNGIIMLADEMQRMPGFIPCKSPKAAGATTGGVMLFVKDVDAFFKRAVEAGATAMMPPADMFWGDRYAQVEDPYGHVWSMGTHIKEVSVKELKAAMAQMPPLAP